jgi:hypothetical protein
MNHCLLFLFIGLWATTDGFVIRRTVNNVVPSTTPMKATGNPQPHESHGIKSAATIALAGLMWVGIESGVPVVQPVSAAASTSSQLEEIIKDLKSIEETMAKMATKKDLNDLDIKVGKLDVKIGQQWIMYGFAQIIVVAITTVAPAYATVKMNEKVTSFEEKLLEVDATIVESAIAVEEKIVEKNAAIARRYALAVAVTVCIVALIAAT